MCSGLPGAAEARGSMEKEKNALKLKERGRAERGAYSTALHPGNAVRREGKNVVYLHLTWRGVSVAKRGQFACSNWIRQGMWPLG